MATCTYPRAAARPPVRWPLLTLPVAAALLAGCGTAARTGAGSAGPASLGTVAAGTGLVALGAPAGAAEPGAAAVLAPVLSPVPSPQPGPGTPGVTVSGVGHASGTPDVLVFSVGVTEQAADVAVALDRASSDLARIRDVLTGGRVPAADINTAQVSVQPHYASGGAAGYDAAQTITVRLHGLARDSHAAGQLLADAVHAGGNAARLESVSLDLGDDTALLATARQRAFADAQAKAQQYAHLAGGRLAGVVSLSEQPIHDFLPYQMGRPMAAAGGVAAPVPISPGTQQVDVTITVTFALAGQPT